jgi:hypothetical protein
MTEEQARAIFLLAGIEVKKIHRLENKYWPEAYVEQRKNSPWWLAMTELGAIEIGWRKRVISINWEDTPIRAVVTESDVTKDDVMAHAYSYSDAVAYLNQWRLHAARHVAQGEEHGR